MQYAVNWMSMFRKPKTGGHPSDLFPRLCRQAYSVRTLELLMKAMNWNKLPIIEDEAADEYRGLTDLNDRKRRDAEAILSACRNAPPGYILEIGTAHGRMTAQMARNAPGRTIYTVNMPPNEGAAAGRKTTFEPDREEIGHIYRQRGCTNVRQILANTAEWEPDFDPIAMAFIDGCHDSDFVYGDTLKTLARCKAGSLILWHDFAPDLADKFHWIHDVCCGVERLFRDKFVTGPVYQLQDSWVGLYIVGEEDLAVVRAKS